MKWFKHDTDMHTDLKIQSLMEKHGLEGYAVWNLCLELLGKEGHAGKLDGQTRWQDGLLKVVGWSFNGESKVKLSSILQTLADLNLISGKSFKYGNLHIPKFHKRADDYTQRLLRTNYEQNTDKIIEEENRIEQKRIEEIRREYVRLKGWDIKDFSDYGRTAKAIKALLVKADLKDDLVVKALEWAAAKKWCDWTLETILRKWADFMKDQKRDYLPDSLKEYDK